MAMPIQLKDPIQIPRVPCGSIQEFIPYLNKHQDASVATLLQPFKSFESELRKVYAQQPDHQVAKDGHINMVPIFAGHEASLKIRARSLGRETDEKKSKYIMTLKEQDRKPNGAPAIVANFKEFQKNFNLFSESSLIDLDWNNVVAAGSSVTTALLPVPEKWASNKRSLREYYHDQLAPASDVDLFIWGLNEEQALEKIKQIEQSIKNSILHEVTTIRTKNAITIASQYPTRHVQIVLRLYSSISEIITGFDVDCACAAYDGNQVYAAPRAIGAFITQCNTIDLTRRSPSYENRLSKYSHRGFEVHWPLLDRTRIDPTIFERSFGRTQGLARLLILEKLPKTSDRERWIDQRRAERGRPEVNRPWRNFNTSNIKEREEDEVADWAVDDQEVASYHTMTVPYGQKYHAAKINRLLYAKDLLLNAEWNLPKDREVYLHRHPCFFGTAAEVLEDCCGHCPVPKTDEEIEVAEEESKTYISGKLKFITDDPGRQEIGSFNPITDDEWTTMAYVGDTARLCQAIVDGDLEHVQDWCAQEEVDVNRRDYTGRTPLHLATMASTPEIVQCLVDYGARLTARLVDGRTALHIAAARGSAEMVKTLMNRSLENEEEEEEKKEARRMARKARAGTTGKIECLDEDNEVLEDDTSSEPSEITLESEYEDRMTMGSFVKVDNDNQTQDNAVLDDSAEGPDFYDVDVIAWDYGFSPLHLAILNGHSLIIDLLASEYGADVMLPVKLMEPGTTNAKGAIMTIVLAMTLPKDKAIEVVRMLIQLGANCAQADMDRYTAFHYVVNENNGDILDSLLAEDRPVALSVVNNVGQRRYDNQGWTPLASAIQKGYEGMVTKLLAHGAKPTLTFEDWVKTYLSRNTWAKNQSNDQVQHQYRTNVIQPIMNAAENLLTNSIHDLLAHGADPQTLNGAAYSALQNPASASYLVGESLLDVVNKKIKTLQEYLSSEGWLPQKPEKLGSMKSYVEGLEPGTYQYWTAACDYHTKKQQNDEAWKDWLKQSETCTQGLDEKKVAVLKMIVELESVKDALVLAGAKSFYDQHPNIQKNVHSSRPQRIQDWIPYATSLKFAIPDLNDTKKDGYTQLFEAVWMNDSETVEKLTLAPWAWKSNTALETPLKIAVQDHNGFSPFSVALLRGHRALAKKIITICITQYHKDDGISSRQRWTMRAGSSDDEDSEDGDEDEGDNALPILLELVNDNFTIDNLGDVATLVKSDVLPLTMINWTCASDRFIASPNSTDSDHGLQSRSTLFEHAVETNDKELLRFLIDASTEQHGRLAEEDGGQECYTINQFVFWKAIRLGRTSLLAEMIKTTGAGISLNQLVKTSGVEVTRKPKYYQGLSVGGKKREDWAKAPGHYIRTVEEKVPPLLSAAHFGSIDSVEWFMSDAPLRRYKEFAEMKKNDKRIKTLKEAGKSFDSTVGTWLALKNDLVLHSAILYSPTNDEETRRHLKLVEYLISTAPGNLEQKTTEGWTPLHLAVTIHRPDIVSSLLAAGANPMVRDKLQRNIVHLMLVRINGAVHTDAKTLETMLELFDKGLLKNMLIERCDQSPFALTPLAFWMSRNNGNYKKPDIIEVLAKYSTGEELEMINGEGDLPIHVAIKQTWSTITHLLLALNSSVLYRENATGRTPLEMSRDIYLASCVQKYSDEQNQWGYHNHNKNLLALIDKPAIEFLKPSTPPVEESKKRTWDICADMDAAVDNNDRKKRRLVSLFEANEVAKRVGGFASRNRWGGCQIVVNGGLIEEGKKDRVGEWLVEELQGVQMAL